MSTEVAGVAASPPVPELDDIQRAVLGHFPLQGCTGGPARYAASYFVVRIDDRRDGREMLRRLIPFVATSSPTAHPTAPAAINLALTYQGLVALGVPDASLQSFPDPFRQGMAARASVLGDTGESSPEHWDHPFGTGEFHVAIALAARTPEDLEAAVAVAQRAHSELPGVTQVARVDVSHLPTGRTHFGYLDGISQPWIEGGPTPASPSDPRPLKAGEFVLGYPDESGRLPPMPQPEVLGRNGSFIAIRKLHERVAAFRRFLAENAPPAAGEELLAAKLVGRWRSGTPLALAPQADDPALAADPQAAGGYGYADDPLGLKCPLGAHVRRANPRDALAGDLVDVALHRILRRGGSYGPPLPDGAMDDDGVDRGIVFMSVGTSLSRQFEFVVSQWLNDGNFVGLSAEKDPIAGDNDGTGSFTIPQRPIRRRLQRVPRFVMTRGGEYGFMPGIVALHWLSNLDT